LHAKRDVICVKRDAAQVKTDISHVKRDLLRVKRDVLYATRNLFYVLHATRRLHLEGYGVASISRLLKSIGLFCKRAL